MSDWTRKGPLPDLPGRRPSDRPHRQFDAASDAGSERGGDRRRPPPFEGDGKVRDFGNWERKGPLSPSAAPLREGRVRSNEGGPRDRKQSPAWGEGRSQDGSRPPRREFQERPQYDRQPTAPEMDNQWRARMRPDAPVKSPTATPDTSVPSSPAPHAAVPHTRPKLNLAKRTVSEAEPASSSATPLESSKSNPFGAARPIDTAAREREIEEKRQLAIRQKKEADDKAREEKKAKESAEKAAPKEKSAAPSTTGSATSKDAKETEPEAKYEIMQRTGGDATNETEDENANGEIVDDKAVKPKEVVRDPPAKAGGSWRKPANAAPAEKPAGTTTEKVEEDGWSTVTKNPKNSRRGGNPSRAIAS